MQRLSGRRVKNKPQAHIQIHRQIRNEAYCTRGVYGKVVVYKGLRLYYEES